MTDMTNYSGTLFSRKTVAPKLPAISVQDTYWGYIIKKDDSGRMATMVMQLGSLVSGAGLLAAGLALLFIVPELAAPADLVMRGVVSGLFFGIALFLLWFASRGTVSEIQFDLSLGEVREIVRNRTGRSSLISRFGFDSIGDVILDRTYAADGQAVLALRYRNTAQILPIFLADITTLMPLRARMQADLLSATFAVDDDFLVDDDLDDMDDLPLAG